MPNASARSLRPSRSYAERPDGSLRATRDAMPNASPIAYAHLRFWYGCATATWTLCRTLPHAAYAYRGLRMSTCCGKFSRLYEIFGFPCSNLWSSPRWRCRRIRCRVGEVEELLGDGAGGYVGGIGNVTYIIRSFHDIQRRSVHCRPDDGRGVEIRIVLLHHPQLLPIRRIAVRISCFRQRAEDIHLLWQI